LVWSMPGGSGLVETFLFEEKKNTGVVKKQVNQSGFNSCVLPNRRRGDFVSRRNEFNAEPQKEWKKELTNGSR